MTREETEKTLRAIKFCIRRKIPVNRNGADYIPSVLNLRYSDNDGFFYTVQLNDINRLNSSITVGIEDVEWPAEGNGYKL